MANAGVDGFGAYIIHTLVLVIILEVLVSLASILGLLPLLEYRLGSSSRLEPFISSDGFQLLPG